MTIIGSAYVEIQALSQKFNQSLYTQVTPGLRSVGDTSVQQANRGKQAFGLMFSTLRSSTAGAFSPVLGFVDHIQNTLEGLSKKPFTIKIAAVGAAGVGVGTGLQLFASKEQAAQQQLAATIQDNGGIYEDYASQIDNAVKHGEHFGKMSYETIDVLNRLTVSSRNPAKALKDYQLVLDIAAVKHISLSSAAQMVAVAYGGNTRLFKQFGMNVSDSTKALSAATSADNAATKAADRLKKAKQNLKDEEARLAAATSKHTDYSAQLASAQASVASAEASVSAVRFKNGAASPQAAAAQARLTAAEARLAQVRKEMSAKQGLTVSQEISLRKARDAVTQATKANTQAQHDKVKADEAAKGSTTDVDKLLVQLQHHLDGQASAAVDNFSGHLKALTARVEDAVSSFGGKYGPAITAVSTGLIGLGAVSSLVKGTVDRFSGSGRTASNVMKGLGDAGKIQASGMHAALDAETNLMNSSTLLKEVDQELGTTFSTTAAETEASMTGMAATAETEIGGQMQLSFEEVGVTVDELPAKMSVAAAGVDSEMASMAVATEANSLRMSAAIGGVVGIIGGFGIGTATAGHGAGGAAIGTLGGAVMGAVVGLSVGGPLGAAIGGLGGALAGLGGHFLNLGGHVSQAQQDVDNFRKSLQQALILERKLGPSSRQAISQFLEQPSNATATSALAGAGITMKQIIQGVRSPGSLGSAQMQAQAMYEQGKITAGELKEITAVLTTISNQFSDVVETSDNIAQINGQVTENMKQTARNIKRTLTATGGQKDASNTLADLLGAGLPSGGRRSKPLPHGLRAGGGPVYSGRTYLVGEHQPELLVMGAGNGYVHPNAVGGDGGSLLSEVRAMRMDFLQLLNAARATTRATEDVPEGVASAIHRGRSVVSPELTTL